ncbi:MAG: MATE family efflux transporter [Lachnospiraceae bacterium]|nr:MATE family efflux transporter [Lachnospiraceae bacterium]
MTKEKAISEKTSLFQLSWPIFVETLLAMLIGNVDTIMLSNYSDTAVGAVSNANQILNLLTLMFSIIASATGVVVAQYLGAKLYDKLSEIYSVSVGFNLVISGVISLAIMIFGKGMLRLIKIPDSLLTEANSYLVILGGFIFLQAMFNTFTQIFRSNGKTKIGMIISLLVNVANIFGNYLFLYGPLRFLNLGVKGVAISSVVSRMIALGIAIYFFVKYIPGNISMKYFKKFPVHTLKKLLLIGIPSAGESISYSISQICIMSFVNMLGLVAVNAKAYASVLTNFAYVFSVSMAQGMQILVGHYVGAGKEDVAYKRVLKTLRVAIILSFLLATINYIISPYTLQIFTKNKETLELAVKVMALDIFLEFGRATNLVVIQSMRAAGDVKFPTYLGMASMWGVSVLLGYVFGIVFHFGLLGVWFAMALDEWVRAIIVYIRWKKGGWRGKAVVEKIVVEG